MDLVPVREQSETTAAAVEMSPGANSFFTVSPERPASDAGVMASDAGRTRLLQLAEKVGLYKEPEHELVPVTDAEGNILYHTCTMHPSVRAAGPGTCPI